MTTPKRDEAVAPYVKPAVFHVLVEDKGQLSPSTGFPSYRAVAAVTLEEHEQCVAALQVEVSRLRAVVDEARRAIGDHHAPNDCYATGPLTGDEYSDLVQCPACSFLAMFANLEPPTDGR